MRRVIRKDVMGKNYQRYSSKYETGEQRKEKLEHLKQESVDYIYEEENTDSENELVNEDSIVSYFGSEAFCKEENIFPVEINEMSCDTLDTNNDNEEVNGDNDDQVSNDIHNTQMSNEIQALLEQKAKRELGGRRDNVGDVEFCFLNTKLKPHSRSWRPELGNLVTHGKYTFHLNQLVKNAKRQSWTCSLGKVIFLKKITSCSFVLNRPRIIVWGKLKLQRTSQVKI